MVYIANWQEFQEAAEGLYEKSPRHVSVSLFFDKESLFDVSHLDAILCKMEGYRRCSRP
jgi:hypothetical protein